MRTYAQVLSVQVSVQVLVSAIKASMQAVIVQMAAAQALGAPQYDKPDTITVSMSHPEGMAALVATPPRVSAHFTSPPYQY